MTTDKNISLRLVDLRGQLPGESFETKTSVAFVSEVSGLDAFVY